ncbi:MAG: hypothetical protein Q9218_000490 [Villophora microphyllina]
MSTSTPHQELLTACAQGNADEVRTLLATCSPDDVLLRKVAIMAAGNRHTEVLELCLNEGAVVTSIWSLPNYTDEVLKVLVTHRSLDVNESWDIACDMLINAVWELNYDFTEWLLERGANPNLGNLMAGQTSAITAATEQGRNDFAELLVKHGAHVSGSGALVVAAENKHHAMVSWVLDREADVNEIGVIDYGDSRGDKLEGTALHKAAVNGDLAMA